MCVIEIATSHTGRYRRRFSLPDTKPHPLRFRIYLGSDLYYVGVCLKTGLPYAITLALDNVGKDAEVRMYDRSSGFMLWNAPANNIFWKRIKL